MWQQLHFRMASILRSAHQQISHRPERSASQVLFIPPFPKPTPNLPEPQSLNASTPRPTYLVYAAYTITSEIAAASSCIREVREQTLTSPFSYTLTSPLSALTQSQPVSAGQTSFARFLGGTCVTPHALAMPTDPPLGLITYEELKDLQESRSTTSSVPPLATPTPIISHPPLSTKFIPAILIPPIVTILIAAICIIMYRRRRKSRSKIPSEADQSSLQQEEPQTPLFLQPKAELAAKDAKTEIDGCERHFELPEPGSRMTAELDTPVSPEMEGNGTLSSWSRTQSQWKAELEGDEAAKEKEGDTVKQ